MNNNKLENKKNKILFFNLIPFLLIVIFMFSINETQGQVRIGYNSTTLESPNFSLLELANYPSNTDGKGLLMPRVTQTQMETMETAIEVPDGMMVYNITRHALMIKQNGVFLGFTSTINWVMTSFTQEESFYDGVNNVFTLERVPVDKGIVQITYNHIPLIQDVDFSVIGDEVTFLTIVPDDKNKMGNIFVEQ